jgi:hypothetical protein
MQLRSGKISQCQPAIITKFFTIRRKQEEEIKTPVIKNDKIHSEEESYSDVDGWVYHSGKVKSPLTQDETYHSEEEEEESYSDLENYSDDNNYCADVDEWINNGPIVQNSSYWKNHKKELGDECEKMRKEFEEMLDDEFRRIMLEKLKEYVVKCGL